MTIWQKDFRIVISNEPVVVYYFPSTRLTTKWDSLCKQARTRIDLFNFQFCVVLLKTMMQAFLLATSLVVLFSREIDARTTATKIRLARRNDNLCFDLESFPNNQAKEQELRLDDSIDIIDPNPFREIKIRLSDDDEEDSDIVSTEKSPISTPDSGDEDGQSVDVKTHVSHTNHKKSNAVGDPDGEGSDSDDDDDSDFDSNDWENGLDLGSSLPQVQMQLELMPNNDENDNELDRSNQQLSSRQSGGGVGLRLGQKIYNHRRNRQSANNKIANKNKKAEQFQQSMVDAWKQYVFSPPASFAFLKDNARKFDADSKLRLDRRTLYACLLLEWRCLWTSERRFLQPSTSQALQAALSLATQPDWRKSLSQTSALRLYDLQNPDQGCTLAMQETIALALVSQFRHPF